jgi:hypothetical protein
MLYCMTTGLPNPALLGQGVYVEPPTKLKHLHSAQQQGSHLPFCTTSTMAAAGLKSTLSAFLLPNQSDDRK